MATGREGSEGSAVETAKVIEGLNDLLQLDHDAIGAYEIAVERLENREHALQIEGFKRDHERHVRALNEKIVELGGRPLNEPHATAPLKQGIQRIAAAGGDKLLLAAWRTNELQVMSRYDACAQKAVFWPADVKALIDGNALDEERHYRWIVELTGEGDAPELHVANRMREGVSRARHFGEQAQERLEVAAESARLRAAEGLAGAAGQLEEMAARGAGAEGVRGRAAEGAQRVARGLDSTAAYLRDGGEAGVRETLEDAIRANPARNLIATFAVGFVLGRILR